MTIRISSLISALMILGYCSAFCGSNLTAQDKPEKIEPKLTIYDDEHLKGKSVIIRKRTADLREVKFSDKSESIAWELPPGKAFVLYDEKNFKLPILVLVGTGAVQDLGKEQRNALHSITSVAIVTCPKGRNPSGVSKDVPRLGEEVADSKNSSEASSESDKEMMEPTAEGAESKSDVDGKKPTETGPKGKPLVVDNSGPSLDEILAAEKMDLRPDLDFKDRIVDVAAGGAWFLTAKKGDFVEYRLGKSSYVRQEVLEKTEDTAIIADIVQISTNKRETRVRMKLAKDQIDKFKKQLDAEKEAFKAVKKKAMSKNTAANPTIETVLVKGQSIDCVVRKQGKSTEWTSLEVPFGGLVKAEYPNGGSKLLTDFARGN